jgi:hypothetical protein
MRIPALSVVAGCVVALCGCVPLAQNINARNAATHEAAARIAARNGDWETARQQYAQALTNARLAHAGAAEEGRLGYEYGRVLGITCNYHLAEEMLDNSQLAAGHAKGVADVRRRYASVLVATGDEIGATAQRTKATALEAANAGSSEEGSFTPYGSACAASLQAN